MKPRLLLVALGACALLVLSLQGGEQSAQTPPFTPFRYAYSTEQLRDQFSDQTMKRAAAALAEIHDVNARGPWKPTWESLDQHPTPEWLRDAKLGVIVNWSLAAVPAWDKKSPKAMYPDAYGSFMYDLESHIRYHEQTWGRDFQYDDFFPLFTAENYDTEGMAALLEAAGARYVIPLCKHHDGVAWWDSAWTRRNFVQMGPHRDLLTPLVEAVRRRGMKLGLYYTYEEYANVTLGEDGKICARIWPVLSHKPATLQPLTDVNRRRVSGNIPVRNYYDQYLTPLVKEMIDRFDPDGLWMDGEWCARPETLHSRELAAYLYNRAQNRKDVAVNDRFGIDTRNHHGDVFMNEFYSGGMLDHTWEAFRGISNSFSYNHEDTDASMMSPREMVHLFVDTISHNGNLNLIIGPDRTGKISDLQVERLKALGRWISVNAEAVYGTRILKPYTEGTVCYTRSKDGRFAYAICKQWPGQRLILHGVSALAGSKIHMLGISQQLAWKQSETGLSVDLPAKPQGEKARPCQYAWVVKIPVR